MVVTPGVSTSSGSSSSAGNSGGRGTPRAISRSARVVAVLAGDEGVLARPEGARKSTDSLPPIIPDSASTA